MPFIHQCKQWFLLVPWVKAELERKVKAHSHLTCSKHSASLSFSSLAFLEHPSLSPTVYLPPGRKLLFQEQSPFFSKCRCDSPHSGIPNSLINGALSSSSLSFVSAFLKIICPSYSSIYFFILSLYI